MEIKPLAVCLAACAALLAVCHGCSTGKEFITTFIPNYLHTAAKNHRLHVVLTAQGSAAKVHIQVGSVNFSKRLTLAAGESRWVSLPCESELQKEFVTENSAVRISSSSAISVVSFNRQKYTGDGGVVYPTQELGTNYFVYTPPGGHRSFDKLLAIVNGDRQNQITILPGTAVKLRGGTKWKRGTAVIVNLAPHASYLVRSRYDLSGTQIRSQQPVAVLTGHQCLTLGRWCEHVYEQLPAMTNLGKEYLVPGVSSLKASNWATVVAVEDNTVVTTLTGGNQKKQTLTKAGDVLTTTVNKEPVIVRSDKKVMALLLSNNKPYDPFLMTLTPTSKTSTDWAVETVDGFRNTIVIMSERAGAGSVNVCVNKACRKPSWKNIVADNRWVWAVEQMGKKQSHVTVEGDVRMSVYSSGGEIRHGYGIAGVCSEVAPAPTPTTNPCESVKCRAKEHCVNGECVHDYTATCYALGDPHYSTFDGRRYDFQGTCNYIMTTVTKLASDLVPFTVTTTNNHRGNSRVSYVRTVTVSVYKQTIVLDGHRGKAQVDGELQYLPITLLGGKIFVKWSGGYAHLTTDFGLSVKYDSNMRLYVTVPSSYFEHLGGLCGNYNGDRSDDLPEPTGASLSAVLTMIKKWKTDKSDKFCNDNCGGHCPTCDEKQQAHYRHDNLCGILTKPGGPFSACHKKIDSSMYLDNCVYDTCINKGARQFLCENIKSYDDVCREEGVKIDPQWRMDTNCPLNCPAGSHYEACGTACPATCGPTDKRPCTTVCVEGCQCNKGLVLSGDRCIPMDKCGCQHEGRYYPADTKFWGDKTCTSRCTCHKGKAKCKRVKCKKNAQCTVKGGVRGCYATSYATCQGSGDPHYRNFDNKRFDFQGSCTYTFSEFTKGTDEELEKFQVLVQNENRGRNKAVSFTKAVSLTVFGITISMSRASKGKILVNSRSVNLPYSMEDGKLSVYRCGYYGIVKTSFGMTLKFNWNSHISLTLPSSYSSSTGGLCGNYNGNRHDDLMKPDGTQAISINAFGHSWKAGGDAACTSDCPDGKCPQCEPAMMVRYQQRRYCGIIADKSGPFGECHSKMDHRPFLTECVFDLCQYQGHASALCNSLSAFSISCQEEGATVKNWRTKEFCSPTCGANSQYEVCAPPCPLTCSGLAPPEGCDESAKCTEGCVCDDGFILSHDKCVPVAECGCQYEGQYYQTGQVFYPGESCNSRCVCSEGGNVKCDPKFSCSVNEKCVVKDGVSSCAAKSVGSCSVSGVRNIRSFDGQTYPLWGNCLFTLAEVEEKKGGMEAFSVNVLQKTHKNGAVSRSVELNVYDMEIIMETGVVWQIKVDQVTVSLPVSLGDGKVQVHQNGLHIIIETDFDLKLTYDSVAGIFLQIPSTYRNLPRGLCGDYNGDVSLETAAAKKPTDTAAIWVVKKDNVQCETSCGATSCPGPDETKVPKAKSDCDIIRNRQGPFAGCHATVNPTPDYDSCVRELSVGKGAADILCRHIQNYVTACQLAGAKIKKWRSDSFCPVKCPAGSHYELCSSSCDSTCFSLERSDACPACQEGCQCNDGLMADGVRCVPVEKCGCVVEGQYYSSGSSVLRGDCTERCTCQSGQFSCKSTSCKDGEECRNKDGTVGCFSTDPCADFECREKEHCEVSEGKGECVPDSKVICWALGDPHYHTFDGYSYSFQGTCSYVLVNTTGRDPTLPEVTVTTKNELRGNPDGSFVRSAIVEILGHSISIPNKDRGIILVDGIKTELPVFLEEGSISITQTGIRGKIQTDIGVEVTFDWATLIMVSLSSSYYNNVAGLCGNYNGNKEDELTTPSGTTGANVTHWAGTWSFEDYDPFCYHYCDGVCPDCSEEDRKKYTGPKYCGILSDKKGPFASCHSTVPVAEFVADCLYDVCVNDGRQEVLCEALSSYLIECQEAGAKVSSWRYLSNCPVECPDHSSYKICGSACPPTCGPQPEVCTKNCVEGCFCDTGYVQSGKECVIRETGCGCTHDGRYYRPGETFWADSQCKEKCTCDGATQKAKCEKTGCRTGEKCDVVNGVQDCYPIGFKTCTARGDPHFHSFDGRKFDFQGNCVYRLASVCGDANGLTQFEVNLENNNRGSKSVSYAKVVTVKIYGNTYTLTRENSGKVLVDELEFPLPFSNSTNKSQIQVNRRHRWAVLETNFLKVSFDFGSSVRVELATSYHNAVCGLCGNLNDDPADDLKLPDGKLASSANQFGVSQWVADSEGCSRECKDCAKPLPPDFKPPSYTSVCDVITAKDGPLADCVDRVESKMFHSDCVYDMVANNGSQQSACNIITDYVEECQLKGGCVRSWRTRRFCWMHCKGHSLYSVTASGCPLTCTSPSPPTECKTTPSEGCVCNPGYLQSEGGCVPFAQCGCHYKGNYIASGQSFYEDNVCKRFCTCNAGMVSCENRPCGKNKRCGVQNGKRGCYPNIKVKG